MRYNAQIIYFKNNGEKKKFHTPIPYAQTLRQACVGLMGQFQYSIALLETVSISIEITPNKNDLNDPQRIPSSDEIRDQDILNQLRSTNESIDSLIADIE